MMRRLLALTCLALATSLFWMPKPTWAAASTVLGDIDGDGQLTIRDALTALRLVAGQHLDASNLNLSNVDLIPAQNSDGSHGDGKVTLQDVIATLRLLTGLDTSARYTAPKTDGGGNTGPLPPVYQPSVRLQVTVPRGTFGTYDPIPFQVSLRNDTDKDASWSFPSSCQVDLQVVGPDGQPAWSPTTNCLTVVTQLALKPGEAKDWSFVWEAPAPYRSDVQPRQQGVYTAKAVLNGTEYASSLNFQVSDDASQVPLPVGPPTFDLTPGRGAHYVNMTRGGDEEVIQTLRYVKQGDQYYTVLSRLPDGQANALLRLDADNNLVQWTPAGEGVRLKLNAQVGDTWTYQFGENAKADAKLVSRNASLKTPAGIYSDLLEFSFFVGPDNSWTEWVHPKGIWVGYTRDTIAGPVEFRLGNQDGTGVGVPSGQDYGAIINPSYIQIAPGEQTQLNLIVVDKTGTPIKVLPGPVHWSVDNDAAGTVDQNGLFTAKMLDGAAKSLVRADISLLTSTVTAMATVVVTNMPTPPPPPPPGKPGPTVTPGLQIQPEGMSFTPGAKMQFQARYFDENGQEQKLDSLTWSCDAALGTIDANGLFTATTTVPQEGVWGVVSANASVNGQAVSAVTKVAVLSSIPTPPPPPVEPAYRMDITPRYATPDPGQTVQFTAQLYDAQGQAVQATYEWYLEDWEQGHVGTVTADGLFTAGPNRGDDGPVCVKAVVNGEVVLTDYAKVAIGIDPWTPPAPTYQIDISPKYAYPKPGEQVTYKAVLLDPNGKVVDGATYKWYLEPDQIIGTVTEDGVFTAGSTLGADGLVWVKAYVDGKEMATGYTKVLVGVPAPPTPSDPSTPGTADPVAQRTAYLEGGSITASIPPTMQPGVRIQVDISGNMPDPSWVYDYTDIQVDGSTIILVPMLRQVKTGPVVAMVVPFKASVFVNGLKSGVTYTVIAEGMDAKLRTEITP